MSKIIENKISIFNNHFRGSNDLFREFMGFFWDLDEDKILPSAKPERILKTESVLKFGIASPISDQDVSFKQEIILRPSNSDKVQTFLSQKDSFGISNRERLKTYLKTNKGHEDFCFQYDKTVAQTEGAQLISYSEQKYNYYYKNYEDKSNEIPEELLPNYYVFSLALNKGLLSSISQSDYDNSVLYFDSRFDKLITLDDNIVFNSENTNYDLEPYYEQYSKVYDDVAVDLLETYKNQFGNIITSFDNSEMYQKLNSNKNSFPMFIDIIFDIKEENSFFNLLNESNIHLDSLQDFVLDKILTDMSDSFMQTFFEANEKIYINGASTEFSTTNHRQKDFDKWFKDYIQNSNGNTVNSQQSQTVTQERNRGQEVSDRTAIRSNNMTAIGSIPFQPSMDDQSLDLNNILDRIIKDNVIYKYKDILLKNFRSYRKMISGNYSKTDILFFRIEKRDKATNNLIQNFYIPNIPNLNIMNYVDTQIKYGKKYSYTIFSNHIVYGTKYKYFLKQDEDKIKISDPTKLTRVSGYENRLVSEIQGNKTSLTNKNVLAGNKFDFKANQTFAGVTVQQTKVSQPSPLTGGSNLQSFMTNMQSEPEPEIIPRKSRGLHEFLPEQGESYGIPHPNNNSEFEQTETNSEPNIVIYVPDESQMTYPGKEKEEESFIFDVIYQPTVKLIECEYSPEIINQVKDYPPSLPNVDFYPLLERGSSFNIVLQDSVFEYKDYFIPILDTDFDIELNYVDEDSIDILGRPSEQYTSRGGKVLFRGDGDTKFFQVFRTETPPTSYVDFTLYKTLKYPDESTLFEQIEPDKKYFYTFRSVDAHGNLSNPTPIYQVEFYNDQLLFIPSFTLYEINNEIEYDWDKSFKKYIKISPNIIHKTYDETNERLGLTNKNIYDKQFMMRIKSKHSGRMIDIFLKFKIDKNLITN